MKELEGSRTKENIKAAFAGESQARNRYTYYAEEAKKAGRQDVADTFARMANNEKMHAKLWYGFLYGNMEDTLANLNDAAKGENTEWRSMYPEFAQAAREEGFTDIAELFERIAAIEKDHEKTFLRTIIEIMSKKDSAKEEPVKIEAEENQQKAVIYRCLFCGAVTDDRPDVCPVCKAIGSFEKDYTERD